MKFLALLASAPLVWLEFFCTVLTSFVLAFALKKDVITNNVNTNKFVLL
jgi:hypothetical protein